MAAIKITELHPAGSELFQDSESFLNELTDDEMGSIEGGWLGEFLAKIFGELSDLANVQSAQNSVSYQTIVSVRGNTINKNTVGNINTVQP